MNCSCEPRCTSYAYVTLAYTGMPVFPARLHVFANALCLQTSDISKEKFTGLELASLRKWCYNPSIWQNLTASRDEIKRRKSRLRQGELLPRMSLPMHATVIRDIRVRMQFARSRYFSSTIARSHGPSVSSVAFETAFPSSRFVPAPYA